MELVYTVAVKPTWTIRRGDPSGPHSWQKLMGKASATDLAVAGSIPASSPISPNEKS